MSSTIALVPVGKVSEDLLDWLKENLPQVLEREVTIGKRLSLPTTGYDAERDQYRGDALIDQLRRLEEAQAERIVGLVEADCYSPGLNFIFGQAAMNGREAIVALPRLRQSFYGKEEDPQLFQERVLKEVVHELGHTWGLSHCPDPHCVMHFSNRLQDTDVKGVHFCPKCHPQID